MTTPSRSPTSDASSLTRRTHCAQTLWRQVQALVDAHRGHYLEAEKLARDAVEIAHRSDGLNMQGEALSDLAEVLRISGRNGDAAEALTEAIDRYDRKRNLVQAAQVREQLAALER